MYLSMFTLCFVWFCCMYITSEHSAPSLGPNEKLFLCAVWIRMCVCVLVCVRVYFSFNIWWLPWRFGLDFFPIHLAMLIFEWFRDFDVYSDHFRYPNWEYYNMENVFVTHALIKMFLSFQLNRFTFYFIEDFTIFI